MYSLLLLLLYKHFYFLKTSKLVKQKDYVGNDYYYDDIKVMSPYDFKFFVNNSKISI